MQQRRAYYVTISVVIRFDPVRSSLFTLVYKAGFALRKPILAMTLRECTSIKTLYLLSVEEPVLPDFVTRDNPADPHWILEKLDDGLPIIGGMYLIRPLNQIKVYPFLTTLIRRANPTIKFQRVYGNRGNLPEPLFSLLPSTGRATSGYNVPKKESTEDKAMRKVLRAFTRDGKYRDLTVCFPDDGKTSLYRLQVVFNQGKHYSWSYDNRRQNSLSSPWKRVIRPLDPESARLYERACLLFPNNPSL